MAWRSYSLAFVGPNGLANGGVATDPRSRAGNDVEGDGHDTEHEQSTSRARAEHEQSIPLCEPIAGGWQNGADDDGNGFFDDIIGWDFLGRDNLPEPQAAGDSQTPAHGTAVAGLVAGIGNNDVASPGVAWEASLMLVRANAFRNPLGELHQDFFPGLGDRLYRDSVIRGLVYAHDNGARVINLSIGSLITKVGNEAVECLDGGIQLVPEDKFLLGMKELETEWRELFASRQDRAVLSVAMTNCGEVDLDGPNAEGGQFVWPVYTAGRPDLGVSFVHSTMITTASIANTDINGDPAGLETVSGFTSFGASAALIGAPGERWRVLAPQSYPATGLSDVVTDCPPGERCEGSSLAAPLVAGGAVLVASVAPNLDAAGIKSRLLDNACTASGLQNRIAGARLLDVSRAVDSLGPIDCSARPAP